MSEDQILILSPSPVLSVLFTVTPGGVARLATLRPESKTKETVDSLYYLNPKDLNLISELAKINPIPHIAFHAEIAVSKLRELCQQFIDMGGLIMPINERYRLACDIASENTLEAIRIDTKDTYTVSLSGYDLLSIINRI